MSPSSSPARLHVFLAREAPCGLILRRGPSKQVCTIGWNLKDDTFELGQWFKGRIYEHRCDFSRDGRHFLYCAAKHKVARTARQDEPYCWTAVSRTPYLKSVAFWKQEETFEGGGQFLGDRLTFRDNVRRGAIEGPDNLSHPSQPYLWGSGDHGIYSYRLRREGWKLRQAVPKREHDGIWEKEHTNWTLQQYIRDDRYNPSGRNAYWQWFQASELSTGETLGDQSWEWADFDGDRLVWAQGGKLFATQIWDGGHGDIIELADFNDWKFQAVQAPY